MMKFHTVESRSFAIGFRVDLDAAAGGGVIAGVVYRDDNQNGTMDRIDTCEPGVPGVTVALEMTLENNNRLTLYTTTDSSGEYSFSGLEQDVYKVFVDPAPENWEVVSTNPLLVTLVKGPDEKVLDFTEANFGLYALESLLLWNKLGSAQEVQNSEVGPNGIIVGDVEYVTCRHGSGMKPKVRSGDHDIPDNFIDFSGLDLGNKGCLEFWYLPDWIDGSVGHVVEIFWYGVAEDPLNLYLGTHFNDWQNIMGMSARDSGQTTSVGNNVRPANIPGWSTTEPFHMAFTWDGTDPVITDRLKFFVNGVRIIGTIGHSGEPTLDTWLPTAVLRLGNRLVSGDWDRHNWEGHVAAIDNVKVWNYPKTDFSDRFVE